ncbi:MAG: hypothetical protein IJJ06_04260 [Mogibacterium sp.]|nr:hypothetical protein [Mogibacterium sp.]
MARIKDDMGLDCYIDDFLIATHTKNEFSICIYVKALKSYMHTIQVN